MAIVAKSEDITKQLVVFREPCDILPLVNKATDNLLTLVEKVNLVSQGASLDVVIDKSDVDEVIEVLQKLESERQWLHSTIEAETITSSVLRHKLTAFPKDIEKEIRDAVHSARDSNAATIQAYNEQLEETKATIKYLEKKLEVVLVSNLTLGPERQESKEKHSRMVDSLNQTLKGKASMQINLNETRDRLTDTINRMKDFKEAFRQLNDDMDAERQETQKEEDRIKHQILGTRKKIEQQRQINTIKNREVENCKTMMAVQETDNKAIQETIFDHKERCTNLHRTSGELSEQLDQVGKENVELTEKGTEYQNEAIRLVEMYSEEKKKLQDEISDFLSDLKTAQDESDTCQLQKIRTMNQLDAALVSEKKNRQAEEMQRSLRLTKDELLHQSSECTRLKRENFELEIDIDKIKQDHIATIEILTKQISGYRESLTLERKERKELQQQRHDINKEATDFFLEHHKFAGIKTKSITEGKAVHRTKSQRGKELQRLLQEAEQTIKEKQEELLQSKEIYIKMQRSLNKKVDAVQSSIDHLQKDRDERTSKYQLSLPGFDEFQETYKRKTDEYEWTKRHIVEVKTNKSKLDAAVRRKREKLEKMDDPKEKVQTNLAAIRKAYLEMIKSQTEEIRQIENDIYNATQRLDEISRQNERFKKAIGYFESDMGFMKNKIEVMHDGKRSIEIKIGEYRDWLEIQWRKHMELDKKYHVKDMMLLDDIRRVEQFTSVREEKVGRIHKQLEYQLGVLTQFIENVSDMRVK